MNIIFLSELANEVLIEYMKTKGAVVLVPKDDRFEARINSHPDLVISIIDNTLIVDENANIEIFKQLDTLGVPYILGNSMLTAVYPNDIAYNAVISKDCLIHNLNHTNSLVLQHAKNIGKKLISVKQGYTKCSTVVVNNNTIITSDQGIHQASKDEMNTLLIQPGYVLLEGHDYGFLGGTSGSFKDTIIFHGDLSEHPDFEKIVAFAEANDKEVVHFKEFPLTDIGSILVYQHQILTSDDKNNYNKHVNIPVFISHEGCPNDCVFCNQRKITAKANAMTLEEISEQIETYSSTLDDKTYIELAFFGGSFTGIDARLQEKYLKLAAQYKKSGKIHAIRLSTRPDYITTEILDRLKLYLVDTIELGVQSLHDEVLDASNRGHQVQDVYKAVNLIKTYDFHLGIQLMVGLPGDTKERAVLSAKLAALLKPECIRIYPTLVIKETELLELCNQGKYTPLSLDQAVDWTKDMYQVFLKAQIPVIRMGLQPTELIAEGKEVLYGPFHPAFRQLVESSYFLDLMKDFLKDANTNASNPASFVDASLSLSVNQMKQQAVPQVIDLENPSDITILCNPKDLSQVIGHKRFNIIELKKEYPKLQILSNQNIKPMTVKCVINYLQEV